MIVAERKQKTTMDKFDRFGEKMPDGRLTAPSDGKVYCLREHRWRKAEYLLSKIHRSWQG